MSDNIAKTGLLRQRTLSLSGRLIFSLGLALVTLGAVAWLGWASLQWVDQELLALRQRMTQAEGQGEALREHMLARHQAVQALRDQVNSPTALNAQIIKAEGLAELVQLSLLQLEQYLREANAIPGATPVHSRWRELEYRLAHYNKTQTAIQQHLLAEEIVQADELLLRTLNPEFVAMTEILDAILKSNASKPITDLNNIQQLLHSNTALVYGVLALGLLLLLTIPTWLFYHSLKYLRKLNYALKQLTQGETLAEPLPETTDELGELARGINQVSQNLDRAARFAQDVGLSQFETQYEAAGQHDRLGASLVEMRDRLRAVSEAEAKRNWAVAGFAKFGEILRTHTDLTALADELARELSRYIGAVQGAVFILEDDKPTNSQCLRAASTYAYERKKYMDRSFALGEGLVGQAARERATILVTEVPEGYLQITSGLGQAPPRCILVVPLAFNGEIYGVLEFASFERFEPHHVEFVEKLAENIASTLLNIKTNERTVTLLRETQLMAEQLRASEEELRQNSEELQATHEEINRIRRELEQQYAAINKSTALIEFDLEGNILRANENFLQLMGYGGQDLQGRHHRILCHPEYAASPDYQRMWDDLRAGLHLTGEFERVRRDGKPVWIYGSYNPVLGPDGKPYKVIKFVNDITQQKHQQLELNAAFEKIQASEEELRQNAEEMQATQEEMARRLRETEEANRRVEAVLNTSVDAIITIDARGRVQSFNPAAERLFGYAAAEMVGQNISILMPAPHREAHDSYLRNYEATGQRKVIGIGREVEGRRKDGSTFPLELAVSEASLHGEKLYVGVLRDITERKRAEEALRQQMEEIQASEEELRQNAEEMQATQEEMRRVNQELSETMVQVRANEARFRALTTNVPGLIFQLWLPSDGSALRFAFASQQAIDLLGYTAEELMADTSGQALTPHPEDADRWGQALADSARKLDRIQWEGRLLTRFGEAKWVLLQASPRRDATGTFWDGILQDITSRKQLELHLSETLERSRQRDQELHARLSEAQAQRDAARAEADALRSRLAELAKAHIHDNGNGHETIASSHAIPTAATQANA